MRRLLLPVSILMVAIVASVLAVRADNAADPTPRDADDSTPPRLDRPILSGTRIPEWLLRPETDAALGDEARRVLTVLPYPPDSMCLSVNRDGNEVASESAVEPHVPGRLQRLVTTAAALEILPPDSVFTTDVVMQSGTPIVDGVLEGDIWIIGRGDPTLSTAAYIDRFGDGRARTDISELADDLAAALSELGVTEVAGAVVGDESRYTAQRDYTALTLPPDDRPIWDADDNAANVVGPLSALLLDDGFGEWPDEVDQALNLRTSDPAEHAAGVVAQLLEERGITVVEASRNGDAPGSRTPPLATIDSPRRDEIVARAFVDGTTAEMLFKEISVQEIGDGDQFGGFFGTLAALDRLGLGDENFPADGSGLSDANTTTCETLISILEHPDVGASIREALPLISETELAGCSPLTADGMRLLVSTDEDTAAVVGHYTAGNGDVITFAMIANHPELATVLEACNPLNGTLLDAVTGHPYPTELDLLPLSPITE